MLKRVSIQNFKSLKDVTLDLQKVNLLIGPNNSGKTNFLRALGFCYDSHSSVVKKRKLTEEEKLWERDEYDEEKKERIWLEYAPNDKYLLEDVLYKRDLNSKLDISILFEDKKQDLFASIGWYVLEKEVIYFRVDNREESYLKGIDAVRFISIQLGKIKIYKPDPNKLDKPAPVGEGADTVNADGSNIVAFLDYILSEYRSTFNKIEQDLRKCVPEFTEINLQNVKSTDELVKQFGDKTFKRLGLTDGRQNVKYWADELSEGTLYFLALLCIINQPNPPKLLLLEEPEKGIHPRRIREVMDFIFRLAEEKDVQIILTSHNEHVLDDFATRPEAVFVFDKDEEGATYVRNLQKDIIEPTNQRNRELGLDEIDLTTNLSENWLYGLLGGVPAIP